MLKQAGRYACKPLKAACIFSGVTTAVFCSAICPSVAMRSWYGCTNSWGRTSASWSFMAPFQSENAFSQIFKKGEYGGRYLRKTSEAVVDSEPVDALVHCQLLENTVHRRCIVGKLFVRIH